MSTIIDENEQFLVIGGGISGIQASLELADHGHIVYLVERGPSIGGKMAQLDKTFPTLDCSICILAPKMVEVSRHPNIRLISYAEIKRVQSINNGDSFEVVIVSKPRYINKEACNGCRLCVEKCPVKVPCEFNAQLGYRKAIYIPFPQAVPATATIDKEHCLFFTRGICQICKKICPADAVDFEQKPVELTIKVKAILVAVGFELLDPSILPQYGYGRFPDVLVSLQYERLLSASGPTGGEILKPSDKTKPKKIVFIQCVGSRNENVKPYCSQICCMYATKQAIITKEHDPEIDIFILYNDLKALGKNHEEFIRRAMEEFQIKYVKGLPGEVLKDSATGKLTVRYADLLAGDVKTLQADMVVLCPAVVPSNGSELLAQTLGIETDEYGFFKSLDPKNPVDSSIHGIYLCGMCQAPKDISSSVMQASAAVARATVRTMPAKAPEVKVRVKERLIGPESRIGVFVCDCGINIKGVVKVPEVVEYAKTLPNVVYAEERLFACSKDSQVQIKDVIERYKLNRVVVAACTPRTHEPLFRSTCEEIGLNPYLFEMANIREHDSWVHSDRPLEATRKAKDLIRMAVARARLLSPLYKIETKVTPTALVIGAGLSGLTATKAVADKGFHVYLLEREEDIGGRLKYERTIPLQGITAEDVLLPLINEIRSHKNVTLLTSAELKQVRGSVGNFEVTVTQKGKEETFNVGVIIVATGSEELKPKGIYGFGEYDNVYSLPEFRRMLHTNEAKIGENIVIILCAGSREKQGRTYCSNVCCAEAIDCALELKKRSPKSQIYILYRDIRLPFDGEKYYGKAREEGITFIRYEPDMPPKVKPKGNGDLIINVFDTIAKLEVEISADEVVLATPMVPREDCSKVSSTLKVPLSLNGFFLEAHPKLRPVDFETDGIYLCGTAHSPQGLSECICQALASASRALTILMKEKIWSEAVTAEVDPDRCIGCGNCEVVCEYGAIKLKGLVSEVNPLLCKGCGVCAVECPAKAITIHHFTDNQISAMITEALRTPSVSSEPKVLSFFCNWCAYAGADMAGVSRFGYPPTIKIIRVMCSGRIDPIHVLQAFLLGADGVLIGGCHRGDCHYISGNLKAEKRIEALKKLLQAAGIGAERLRFEWISAGEGQKLARVVEEFTAQINKLGPNPLGNSALKGRDET
jgi:heterodisulfide reductase subunit A